MIGNEEIDMKKYVKPELFYEQFESSKHIADCAWELTSREPAECEEVAEPDTEKIPVPGNLFVSEENGCTVTSEEYQDYCYQGGAEGANVFKS